MNRSMATGSEQAKRRYVVTCSFDESVNANGRDAIDSFFEAIDSLRDEGIEIIHAESTFRSDHRGRLTEMEARIDAPTEGCVGRLACRARLPASGIRTLDFDS